MPKCLFCEASANSKEHAWPDWISPLLIKKPRPKQYRVYRESTLDNAPHRWHSKSLDQTVGITCKPCNQGWMSDLEGFAKPALLPLILGLPTSHVISLDDQAAIIAWCMKMAIVFEHTAHKDAERFYTRDEHLAFRETLTPPDGVYIWILNFRSTAATKSLSNIQNLHIHPPLGTRRARSDRRHLQATSIVINNFAFQVVAGRWHERVRVDLDSADRHRWRDVTRRIWPNDDVPLQWPPPVHLTDQHLKAFTHRWATGVSFLGK